MAELSAAITRYLEQWNLNPRRYEWKADEKTILEKIARAREALASQANLSKVN